MPLARLRCDACSEPLGDPPYSRIAVRCNGCGRDAAVEIAGDGAPPLVDASFGVGAMLAWLAAARVAMASGRPGVALGPCPRCRAPLVVSSREPVSLPCPHCAAVRTGAAIDLLVDQWPEPWAKVEGAGTSLEYRLSILDDHAAVTAGCAHCGWATPAADPSPRCARCGAITWSVRADGRRVQLGVRIDGERDGRPLHALVPVCQGEAILRGDAVRTASADSGTSVLSVTGLGCAVAVALGVITMLAIAVAIYLATRHP